MAGLIKSQILKHLSKFTKNLSSDKINVSTFKGEGELSNLELNEDILTQLLELPTWLRITKAVCNRVAVKIQWTKLKSQPICLYLDEIIIETETCEQPRTPSSSAQQMSGGKYGFVDRVMDGIYVHVNSVQVKLLSHKFHASLQLSRVKVQSMTPNWQQPSDLRSTRIRDGTRGEVLLFKEIEWQTTRIEATAVSEVDGEEDFLTPLRLIANQAKIRIVVKKRLSDSAIISSRLILLLDDLLWVLTITQLKAAILYANSLKELIERSARQSKTLAAEKLKKQGHMQDGTQQHYQQQQQRSAPDRQESTTAKYFSKFDVVSTSYHLITSRFDLHLCDDSSPAEDEKRHWKINGGSMQITFYKLSIDFYPFHPAGGERKSWYRYMDNVGSRNPWVNKLFSEFRDEAVTLRKVCEANPMTSSSSAPSLLTSSTSGSSSMQQIAAASAVAAGSRSGKKNLSPTPPRQYSQSVNTSPAHGPNHGQRNSLGGSRSPQVSPSHQAQGQRSTRLLESCFVLKVEDVTVYMVSMPGHKRTGHSKLLCSDKRQLHLPPDMSVVHVEYTDYFFPEGLDYPVPHPNMYVLVNPVRLTLDFLTLLWSNVFLLTLSQSLDMDFGEDKPAEHKDIKVELLMPRVIIPAEEKVESQPDRPDALQLQISKLVVCNRRTEERMGREDLRTLLEQYASERLLSSKEFPMDEAAATADQPEEWIPQLLFQHANDTDNPYLDKSVKTLLSHNPDKVKLSPSDLGESGQPQSTLTLPPHKLSCDSLKRAAVSDVWSACADQVWLEFLGVQNFKNRPVPFVEAIPITVWMSVTDIKGCHRKVCSAPVKGHSRPRDGHSSGQSNGHSSQVDVMAPEVREPPSSAMPVLGSSPPVNDRASRRGHATHPSSSSSSQSHPLPSSSSPNSERREVQRSRNNNSTSNNRYGDGYSRGGGGSSGLDPHSDGNSLAGHYHHSHQYPQQQQPQHQQQQRLKYEEDEERRPSKLSLSGGDYSCDGSRRSKTRSRSDSPCRVDHVNFSSSRGGGSQSRQHYSTDPSQGGDSTNLRVNRRQTGGKDEQHDYDARDYEGQGYLGSSPVHNEGISGGHHSSARKRRETLHREDSRSSSSPPLGQRTESGRRREESRDRKNKESGRRVRHSSSSSSDRREMDGYCSGEPRGRGEIDGRSSGEPFTGYEDRYLGPRSRRTEDSPHSRGGDHRMKRREVEFGGRDEDGSFRDRDIVGGQGSRQSRHSSSSSSEFVSSVGGSSRGRRGHQRSSSRERRGSTYERQLEELERKSPRDPVERYERQGEEFHRRHTRDGSRGVSVDRKYDRSEDRSRVVRLKDRDQMDGIPSSSSTEQFHASSDVNGEGRNRRSGSGARLHRSQSRDREGEDPPRTSQKLQRGRHGNSDGFRGEHYSNNNVDSRSSDPPRSSRYAASDADCDNDRFSQTSHSSADTIGRDGGYDQTSYNHHSNNNHSSGAGNNSRRGQGQGSSEPNTNNHNPEQAWTPHGNRPPPEGCKSSEDGLPKLEVGGEGGSKMEAEKKVCILTKINEKLRIQINHFQYLFLLRLSESFAAFQTDLSADLLAMMSLNNRGGKDAAAFQEPPQLPPSPITIVPLMLKELEVAVVCPYQMHQRTFSDDFSVISPFLQGVTTGQDAVFGDEGEGTCFPQLVDNAGGRQVKDDSSLRPGHQTISFKSHSSSQLENLGHTPLEAAPRGKGGYSAAPGATANTSVPTSQAPTPFSSENFRRETFDSMSQSVNSLGKDSGIGIERKPPSQRQQQRGGGGSGGGGKSGKGPTDMKKAFTSAFSSFTDKLKNKMEGLDDAMGDDLETMSIRTDTSDDDFEHLSLDDTEEMPAFFHDPPPPDVASVADSYSEQGEPGDSVSMYAESSTTKGKEMVYAVLFKLDHLEVLAETGPDGMVARAQLARLGTLQLGNICYEDFQARFSTARGYIQEENTDPPPSRYPIKFKFAVQAPQVDAPPDVGHASIHVDELSLQFKMSGVTCLADFAEDEKLPEFLPMSLELRNLFLVLEEDRPPANVTSPGAVPTNVRIQQLSIDRGKDGLFHIAGAPLNSSFGHVYAPTPTPSRPEVTNAVTSPILSPDGTMSLLMAAQNEAVLLRRQLEEVRRANRLYEHQILQWRGMQETTDAGSRPPVGPTPSSPHIGARPGMGRKRQSFTSDILSGSPSSTVSSVILAADHVAGGGAGGSGSSPHPTHEVVDPLRDELEKENLVLQQRVTRLEDDLLTVSKEKESLLQTLQLLQDELLASERKQRAKTK